MFYIPEACFLHLFLALQVEQLRVQLFLCPGFTIPTTLFCLHRRLAKAMQKSEEMEDVANEVCCCIGPVIGAAGAEC